VFWHMVTYPRGAIFLYRGASVTVGRCDCADNDLRGRGKRSLEDAVELNAQRRDVGDDVRVRRNVRCVALVSGGVHCPCYHCFAWRWPQRRRRCLLKCSRRTPVGNSDVR
jgi:hypothetical protein